MECNSLLKVVAVAFFISTMKSHALPPAQDPQGLQSDCGNVFCPFGTVCRSVLRCPFCPVESVCVPIEQVPAAVDEHCQRANYLTVMLAAIAGPRYGPLICNPFSPVDPCPRNGVCVQWRYGQGVCCTGRPVTVEKPGVCPARPTACGGLCTTDSSCPGYQKCCSNPNCPGPKRCVEPHYSSCQECPADRPVCVSTGIVCITQPCPSVECRPSTCPPCPLGQICITSPSGSECVPYLRRPRPLIDTED